MSSDQRAQTMKTKEKFSQIFSWCVFWTMYMMQLHVNGATINDTTTLLSDLAAVYNKHVRPVYDQNNTIDVRVGLYVKSIQEFDEVQERFSFVGALVCRWKDEVLTWNPNGYGGITEITLSYDDVWIPELLLSSPSTRQTVMGKSTDRVRVYHDGNLEWIPSSLIQSTCGVNVRYYPFDTQTCTTSFTSLGYKNFEVNLREDRNTVDFSLYQENSLWKVVGSEVSTALLGEGGESEIKFTISLNRKSTYVVINLLIPILVLSLLNSQVFLLVTESGERIGYCVTTLLAIAVYMTIVSDLLPQTSEPVPLISYKLMADMTISSSIVIVTIINMRIYNKPDDELVSERLQAFYNTLSGNRCKGKRQITPLSEEINEITLEKSKSILSSVETAKDPLDAMMENLHNLKHNKDSDKEVVVTWKMVGVMFDWIALAVFLSASILSFLVFIGLTLPA